MASKFDLLQQNVRVQNMISLAGGGRDYRYSDYSVNLTINTLRQIRNLDPS
jgi:hypothetical protein